MEIFKEYFITLFLVCVLCALCDIVSGFTSEGLTRALKLVCSLTLLLAVFPSAFSGCGKDDLQALTTKLTDFNAAKFSDTNTDSVIIEKSKNELENNVSLAIYEKFGIKPDSVSIEFTVDKKENATDVSVASINVQMPKNTDKAIISAVNLFINELFGTDIQGLLTE